MKSIKTMAIGAVLFAMAGVMGSTVAVPSVRPQYAFKVEPVVLRGPSPSPTLRWKQRPDERPFPVRYPDPLAQDHASLQDVDLNQTSADLGIPFVHDTWLQIR